MNFKVGDIVTPKTLEEMGVKQDGLPYEWTEDMLSYIGKQGVVTDIYLHDLRVEFEDEFWYYHFDHIKKVETKKELKLSDLEIGMKVRIKTREELLDSGWIVKCTGKEDWYAKGGCHSLAGDMVDKIGKIVTVKTIYPYFEKFYIEECVDLAWDIEAVAEIIESPQRKTIQSAKEVKPTYVNTKTAMQSLMSGKFDFALPKSNKVVGMYLNSKGEPKKATYSFGFDYKEEDFVVYPEYIIEDEWQLFIDEQKRWVVKEITKQIQRKVNDLCIMDKLTEEEMTTIYNILSKFN